MLISPFSSLGLVVTRHGPASDQRSAFLGTCFAFLRPDVLVTAAHCVRGKAPEEVGVAVKGRRLDIQAPVRHIVVHPHSDLALLHLQPHRDLTFLPLRREAEGADDEYGAPVVAYGFPEDVMYGEERRPTIRVFRGHVQRAFPHRSHMGYTYGALELSIAAPAGLSGGPVVPDGRWDAVLGVVTENFESTTYLRSIAEYEDDRQKISERVHSVVNYAVCAPLGRGWVEDETRRWPELPAG